MAPYRTTYLACGKVLGGSSSMNGMLYVRDNSANHDGWLQMDCRGRSLEDVLPSIQQPGKIECRRRWLAKPKFAVSHSRKIARALPSRIAQHCSAGSAPVIAIEPFMSCTWCG
jgi:choline dehydrogenase-like flavoprotein